MGQNETMEKDLSEDTAEHADSVSESLKLVPVSESIRYRKRAQIAERQVETLSEQLAEARAEAKEARERLSTIRTEQELARKLAAAGAVDLEAAVLIARARMEGEPEADLGGVVEQLRKEKQYLFAEGKSRMLSSKKTTGAKERIQSNEAVLERAAKKAATTGSRTDLQEYLKLRRNII
jgi:ABC-type uncharacterized transport system involved in gliding motility auxiliary subunit